MSNNRRDALRAAIQLGVEYKRLNSFFADYTKNISKGGTFIKTNKPLPIGTEFMFNLTIPDTKALSIRGKVQWVVKEEQATKEQEAGMGIGFIYESESQRQFIDKIVEDLMVQSLGQDLYNKLMLRSGREELVSDAD